MNFRIRSKPIKPIRKKNVKYTMYLYDYDNLGCLNEWLKKHNATLDDVTLSKKWGYYDDVDIIAEICVEESNEDFEKRMKDYKNRKVKYDEWYKTNKESIEKELERRKKAEIELEKKRRENDKRRKEKEKVKLEKKLAELKRELGE